MGNAMTGLAEAAARSHRLQGCILTPAGWVRGSIAFADHVEEIRGEVVPGPSAGERLVLPGFIDLHVHGGGGADIMNGQGAIETVARLHAKHGTTALLATTITAPLSDLKAVLTDIGRSFRERRAGVSRLLGVHLEGPYINSGKLGAQPNHTRAGSMDELRVLSELAPIRIITIAPEIDGHLDFVRAVRVAGMIPQIGHTLGTYEQGIAALDAGALGFTHLYNAMTEVHHRAPGMVGAAFARAEFAELIPDLLHVHPGAIRAAARAVPKLFFVTDSTAGAGMPDGTYRLGSHSVVKCLGGVRLADGTLAGSTLTMDRALKNLVSIGFDVADAARRLSTFPADYIGAVDRGRLSRGCWADLVLMGASLELEAVFVEGASIDLGDA